MHRNSHKVSEFPHIQSLLPQKTVGSLSSLLCSTAIYVIMRVSKMQVTCLKSHIMAVCKHNKERSHSNFSFKEGPFDFLCGKWGSEKTKWELNKRILRVQNSETGLVGKIQRVIILPIVDLHLSHLPYSSNHLTNNPVHYLFNE